VNTTVQYSLQLCDDVLLQSLQTAVMAMDAFRREVRILPDAFYLAGICVFRIVSTAHCSPTFELYVDTAGLYLT